MRLRSRCNIHPRAIRRRATFVGGLLVLILLVFGLLSSVAFGAGTTPSKDVVEGTSLLSGPSLAVANSLTMTRYEETDPNMFFSGSWRSTYSSLFSARRAKYSFRAGDATTISFSGTSLTWISRRSATSGKAQVTLDGGDPITVDLYSSRTLSKQVVYSTGPLTDGPHTLRIASTGLKNPSARSTYVYIDAIDVVGSLIPATTTAAPTTTTTLPPTTTTTRPPTTTTTAASTTTTTVRTTTTTSAPSTTTTTVRTSGRTFYVDATAGSDTNNGTSASTPWKTLAKVRSFSSSPGFTGGDAILLKRGQTWRESMQNFYSSGSAGSSITFDAYGTGANPVITGGVDLSNAAKWTNQGGNVWRYATPTTLRKDIGFLIFNNEAGYGVKKLTAAGLASQGDFYYDFDGDYLVLYSVTNPGTFYSHIEGTVQQTLWWFDGRSYITMRNITYQYSGWHMLEVANSNHITIEHCKIRWAGGAIAYKGSTQRDGNGIEIWGGSKEVTFRYNSVENVWETGVSLQHSSNPGSPVLMQGIYVYGNVFTRCARSFDYWLYYTGDRGDNINFVNNVAYELGGNPDAANRTGMPVSAGYLIYEYAPATNSRIQNNIFHTFTGRVVYVKPGANLSGWTIDYNCYYPVVETHPLESFNYMDGRTWYGFAGWQQVSGKDAHSTNRDPLFVNAAGGDFRLQSNSPCIGSGIPVAGIEVQSSGQAPPNIGAF